jgi:hypothetical protein
VVVAAALLFLGASVLADTITLVRDPVQYSNGNGGEFRASAFSYTSNPGKELTPQATGNLNRFGGVFQTFCIEPSEFFTPGSSYYFTATKNVNKNGGAAVLPLRLGTAQLFDAWWKENATIIPAYRYNTAPVNANRIADAGDMQQVIWALQYDAATAPANTRFGAGTTATKWYDLAVVAAGGNVTTLEGGTTSVWVLNLWTSASGTGFVQDQLVVLNDKLPAVPLPSSALGVFGALGSLLVVKRRRANPA